LLRTYRREVKRSCIALEESHTLTAARNQ
jgi:hypothetical protein